MSGRLITLFPVLALALSGLACQLPAGFTPLLPHTGAMLGFIMFAMGLTLTPRDFLRVMQRPAPVLLGLTLQFLVMPAAAWLLAHVLQLPVELAVGLILLGCVAGGTASNVVTYLAGGDVPLSVTMTACSTLLSVVLTPLLARLYLGADLAVDVLSMLWGLVQMVLLPVTLGLAVARLAPRLVTRLAPALPVVAMAAILLLIAAIVAGNQAQIAGMGAVTLLAVVLHNALGLAGGYWGARLLGFDDKVCRTIAIEVGMQNSGLAAHLAKSYFSALSALPGALFSIWHNLTGSALAAYWRRGAALPAAREEGAS